MQNIYGNSEKEAKAVCRISDYDSDLDDYENVPDSSNVPPVPERSKAANIATAKREDLQLKCLDLESPAVNAAFRDQIVEQTSEKKRLCDWKKVLAFCLAFLFLFWILQAGVIFIYYFNISNQFTELKKNASQIRVSTNKERETWKEKLITINQTLASQIPDSMKKERETWREELIKINQTFVNEMAVLKSDMQYIKKILGSRGFCMFCPAEWTRLDTSCYFFSASPQTWENAQQQCRDMNSYLLFLNNAGELDTLRPLIGSKRFWIGLKMDGRHNWRWVDGRSRMYTNWNKGEPNNAGEGGEHCTEMIAGRWNDLDCSRVIDYICRKSTTC
ncbi:CD209 antigen-like protein B isoform X2 [Eleutherodactylus coqui]|uniref:CD209 antigen-like protein B isoform X2 n=1 Tax=Eleutherodactylus coqui TaxID=57060 RepID=UPI003461BFAD